MFCCSCLQGTSSETSSYATIRFPKNLPDSIKNGGYSICVEKRSEEPVCSNFLIHKKFSDSPETLYVDSDCKGGYRLKMWLWGDENHKPIYGIDPNKSSSQYEYEGSYLIIDYDKHLSSEYLDLQLNFLPTEDDGRCQVD